MKSALIVLSTTLLYFSVAAAKINPTVNLDDSYIIYHDTFITLDFSKKPLSVDPQKTSTVVCDKSSAKESFSVKLITNATDKKENFNGKAVFTISKKGNPEEDQPYPPTPAFNSKLEQQAVYNDTEHHWILVFTKKDPSGVGLKTKSVLKMTEACGFPMDIEARSF